MLAIQSAICLNPIVVLKCAISLKRSSEEQHHTRLFLAIYTHVHCPSLSTSTHVLGTFVHATSSNATTVSLSRNISSIINRATTVGNCIISESVSSFMLGTYMHERRAEVVEVTANDLRPVVVWFPSDLAVGNRLGEHEK